VFVAGQIGIDRAGSALVAGGIREETRVALEHLEAILAASGLELSDVVSTTVYLADLGEFAAMNEVYAARFPSSPPARATVGVLALPKGARVEIAAIAVRAR
jgi:2-iminobutanoate/2-iminopropanoate deaminase